MSPDEKRPPHSTDASNATPWWIAIGVLAVIAIALYAWKVVAVNQAEDRLEQARGEWRQEASQALEARTKTLLRLSAEPLGLAVRDAAMAENYGTVGSYLDRVARIEGVRGAVFAVGDTIRVATDASLEGRALARVVPAELAAGDTRVVLAEEGVYHAVVPITGLNERIGILVLDYAPPDEAAAPPDTAAGGE